MNLKPILPVAFLLAWLSFVISCEKPEGPSVDPDTPGDTTIIIPPDTIVVPVNQPLALFTVQNNNCTSICSLSFTNISIYADTYSWDFGDGSNASTEFNPFHYYTASGTYRVILTASKSGQAADDRDTQFVEIKRPTGPYGIGTSKSEYGAGLVQTGDGGYVVAGSRVVTDGSLDVYLFKTDASRNLIWEKNFGGTGDQVAYAIKLTNDGGYVIVGSTGSGEERAVYLLKTDAEGNLIWDKTFNSTEKDSGEDVVPTSDGGFLLTGSSYLANSNIDSDLLLIKTDAQGNVLWKKRLGSSKTDTGYTIQQTSDGNFVVGGFYNYGPGGMQPYMLKINSAGDIIWEKYTAAGLLLIRSVQETTDGGIIWAGMDNVSSSHWRGIITKTDAEGAVEWSRKFPQPGVLFNGVECVRETADGGYIVCGQMDESGYDFPARRPILVIKTDAVGIPMWTKTYAVGGRVGNAFDIQQTPEGGYILVGSMLIEPSYQLPTDLYLSAPTDNDVYLLKLDANGIPE